MFGRRDSSDTRTKREKLEAMANQTASPNEAAIAKRKLAEIDKNPSHPLFKRRSSDPLRGTTPEERASEWARNTERREKRDPKPFRPHEYAAYGGSDAMGCRVCGRSKYNKYANHTNVGEEPQPKKRGDPGWADKERYQDATKEQDREHDKAIHERVDPQHGKQAYLVCPFCQKRFNFGGPNQRNAHYDLKQHVVKEHGDRAYNAKSQYEDKTS